MAKLYAQASTRSVVRGLMAASIVCEGDVANLTRLAAMLARVSWVRSPSAYDFQAYTDGNRIERMLNRLKQSRRVASRYDKPRKSFSAFLALAAVRIWLPYCVSRT